MVPKDEARGYKMVQRRLVKLRESGEIPYGWIIDNVRIVRGHNRYAGPGDYARVAAEFYCRDYWSGSPVNVEKGNTQGKTYVNIHNNEKRIDSNSLVESREPVTTLRPTTLTTLIPTQKNEKAPVVCIHNLDPEACAVCSGYVRWLIEDEARISAAESNPGVTRQLYRKILTERSS